MNSVSGVLRGLPTTSARYRRLLRPVDSVRALKKLLTFLLFWSKVRIYPISKVILMNLNFSYAAGLFDGEGTVTLSKRHKTSKRVPYLELSNTSVELLLFMKTTFGGCICTHKKTKKHHTQARSWRCTHNAAISCLKKLLPYLREPEKIRRATLIAKEYKHVTVRNGKYSLAQHTAKTAFEARFFQRSRSLTLTSY